MIYTVTFNPAIDYVIHTGTIISGQVNRTSSEQVFIGGKGINVSFILKQLNIESVALGFIAGFTGDAIEKGAAEMGVSSDFVRLDSGSSRINVKIKSDEETEINGQGPDISPDALNQLFEKLDKLRDGDVIILAGSIPKSLPPDIYEIILKRLSDRDILTVVDASKDLLLNVLKYRPFLIKPNNFELEELFSAPVKNTDDVCFYAKKLQEMGAENVLVSMAGDGAVLLDKNGETHICGVCKGTVKNSVGAGDSMLAGFIAGYLKSGFAEALRLGTACGGATAFSEGLADRAVIDEMLAQL